MRTRDCMGRSAVIWCTDGGDHKYWRYSIASMRAAIKGPADFFVITLPTDDLHGLDYTFNLRRIDPTPYMAELGFTKEGYDRLGKRWPVAILYKLCVPLIDELKRYSAVMTLDTDVMAMPTSKRHTVDDVLAHPLGEFEVAGVPDLYEPLDRVSTLIDETTPDDIRAELEERVWSKYGRGCQAYISAGLFLWNIPVINRDTDWYIRRCKAFWDNIRAYIFPEQDFVNGFMAVDSRLQSTFGARASGNGPYIVADACMRHFTGIGKSLMYRMAERIPEITPKARFDQARLTPRPTDIDPAASSAVPRRCIVWSCSTKDDDVKRLNYAIDSMKDKCGDRLSGVDLFVLSDGTWLSGKLKRDDVTVLDISRLYDLSGFRAICNWRSGWITWDRTRLARLFVPFVPELQDYDLALFVEGDMVVTDGRMADIFSEDVRGYDYAMSAEHDPSHGIYPPHKDVRFCKAFLQAMYDVSDLDEVLGRLNAGIYFSTSVFLANMREARKTFRSLARMCRLGTECVGNGAPAVEKDLLNSVCRIKRVSGAYNTAGSTHWPGEPTYCVHNYSLAREGEKYPRVGTSYYR